MVDNFNVKQFLAENKLGPYSRLKTEGEAAYEYEKGKAAGEKEEKEKLAKEDYAGAEEEKMMDFLAEYEVIYRVENGKCYRITDEGYKDEVDMSKCRMYAEGKKEKVEEGQGDLMAIERIEEIVNNLARNISTNSNIPTQEKLGLVQALKELKDLVEDLGTSVEMGMDETKKPVKEGEDVFADIDDDITHGTDSKEDAIEYLEDIINYCQKKIVELENEKGYEEEDKLDEAMGGKNPEGDALVLRFLQGVAKKFNYPVSHAANFVKNTIKSLGY